MKENKKSNIFVYSNQEDSKNEKHNPHRNMVKKLRRKKKKIAEEK